MVQLKDFELTQARKEIKRPGALRSVSAFHSFVWLSYLVYLAFLQIVSYVKEERLLVLKDGIMFSLKRIP